MLSEVIAGVTSAAWSLADFTQRVRYRRLAFWRLPAVEMRPDAGLAEEVFQWLPDTRIGGRSRAALSCPAGSRVIYEVTIPPDGVVTAWCALASARVNDQRGGVEFEIEVRTERARVSARRVIDRGEWSKAPRWQALRVATSDAGPARIALATRSVGDPTAAAAVPLWGDPGIHTARPWRDLITAVRVRISRRRIRAPLQSAEPSDLDGLYRVWVRENEPSRQALKVQREWSRTRSRLFSLVTFVAEPGSWRPQRTAASVQKQTYPAWEWILVAPEDTRDELARAVARVRRDRRVRILTVARGSSRADAWNAALQEAQGEFAGLLGPRDVLAPGALYEMAHALERLPECDVLYSDEDRITEHGVRRHGPRFKPDWSPDLLLASNYIGRLAMLRVAMVIGAGLFRDGAEEWDLLLRLSGSAARVHRVTRCLYHGVDEEQAIGMEPGTSAVRDHCEQMGLDVTVSRSRGGCRVVWSPRSKPRVSIIIPNRDAAAVLRVCLHGLLQETSYPSYDVVIVDNRSTEPETLELYRRLERDGRGIIVPFDQPFNFSAACNAGAAAASGALLLFLNNDIEIVHPDWLDELVRWALRPDVGVVGAKLLYPDRTIQHAGVVFGLGLVGHIFSKAPEGTSGIFGSCESYRNYLAVTGACQMMRREVFDRIGGYDERFQLAFSDVVLCMEAWKAGYRVVYTPHARLVHHESFTRKRSDSQQDIELLVRYLQENGFTEDPYFHPGLNAKSTQPALRPPFDQTPGEVVQDYIERVLAGTVTIPVGSR